MYFHSFKKELLFYTLGLTSVTIILTTAIGIFSTKTAGDDAADATSAVLRVQAEELLVQIATAAAEQQDLLFEQIRNKTINVNSKTGENMQIINNDPPIMHYLLNMIDKLNYISYQIHGINS